MTDSNTKGSRGERELVNYLYDDGWGVMRSPASGASTLNDLPDVLAGNGWKTIAIEAKVCGDDVLYIPPDEVEQVIDFAGRFGAGAYIGVRFDIEYGDPSYGADYPGWYFFHPEDIYRTDSGTYRIKKETALAEGTPIYEL